MKRRSFFRSTGLTLAGAAATATLAPSEVWSALLDRNGAERHGLGLQLWTVRNQIAKDPQATLAAVAKAGYQQVELMNVLESVDLAKTAKDQGLQVRSAFFNWETICSPADPKAPTIEAIIDGAKKMGLEYLVFGYIGRPFRDTLDKMKGIADRCNQAAEKVVKAGMKLSYHNHSFEFEKLQGGITGYDVLIERLDLKLVQFEVDVFWVAIGGWDPLATMQRLGERMSQIHLKDLKAGVGVITDEGKVPEDAFQEVGDGIIDMKKVLEIADKFGVKQFHVEQDQSPDPIHSISQSRNYLKTIW